MLTRNLKSTFYFTGIVDSKTNSYIHVLNFANPNGFESLHDIIVKNSLGKDIDYDGSTPIYPIDIENSVITDTIADCEFTGKFFVEFIDGKSKLKLKISDATAYYLKAAKYSKISVAFSSLTKTIYSNEFTMLYDMTAENGNSYCCVIDEALANLRPDAITIIISRSDDENTLYSTSTNDFLKNQNDNIYAMRMLSMPKVVDTSNPEGCYCATDSKRNVTYVRELVAVASCKIVPAKEGSKLNTAAVSADIDFVPNILCRGMNLYYTNEGDIILSLAVSHLMIDSKLNFLSTALLDIYACDLPDDVRIKCGFSKLEFKNDTEEARIYFKSSPRAIKTLKFLNDRKAFINLCLNFARAKEVKEFSIC